MNLQPYIIYMYIYILYIYIYKQTWPVVKATYKVVQVNACQNNYKMKIIHAFKSSKPLTK